MPLAALLDTNVWVSAFLKPNGPPGQVVAAWGMTSSVSSRRFHSSAKSQKFSADRDWSDGFGIPIGTQRHLFDCSRLGRRSCRHRANCKYAAIPMTTRSWKLQSLEKHNTWLPETMILNATST